jgi:hypothetical protein
MTEISTSNLTIPEASFRTLLGTNILFDDVGAIGEIFVNPDEMSGFLREYEKNLKIFLTTFLIIF